MAWKLESLSNVMLILGAFPGRLVSRYLRALVTGPGGGKAANRDAAHLRGETHSNKRFSGPASEKPK